MSRHLRATLGALLVSSSTATAADVIAVTPITGLQNAVDHASPSDVLLLTAGSYPETVVVDGKGISIVASGGSVTVRRLLVRNVPAGETFLLQGVQVVNTLAEVYEPAFLARDNAGALRLQDCTISGHGGSPGYWPTGVPWHDGVEGARVVNSASVAIHGSTIQGGGGGWLEDEDFDWFATSGGAGLVVTNATVFVFDSLVRGGTGGTITDTVAYGAGAGGDALRAYEGARVQVHGGTLRGGHGGSADCDFFLGACGSGGSGGDCLELHDAATSVVVRDATYEPGSGGADGDGGGSGPTGLPQRILGGATAAYPAPYRDFDTNSPVREGQLLSLTFDAQIGDALFLFAGLSSAHVEMPFRQGVFLVGPPYLLLGTSLGLAQSQPVGINLVAPELGPGIDAVDLQMQAAFGDGTSVLLGPAGVVTLLDASF